jgi:cation:H+ antiporter
MKRLLGLLGVHHPLEGGVFAKIWPFPAVVSATLLIAWATEVAAFFMSRGLALAILAFLQVAPEFAVEAVLAKNAALDSTQLQYVTANFTGANRLLVGAALPAIFLIGRRVLTRQGRWPGFLEIQPHHAVEILALTIPSVYSLVWVIRGGLGLLDTVVLVAMFGGYLWMLSRMPPAEESEVELLRGVPKRVMDTGNRKLQRNFAIGAFVIGGGILLVSAEPFVHGMQDIGLFFHISSYLLLQWIAPLLSEFPEFFTVIYWSRQARVEQAFMNIVAAKINQWTLLIAMIPLVYAITHIVKGLGDFTIEFDGSQRVEILLTTVQGLFAAVCLFKFRFLRWEAYALLGLWLLQLFDPVLDPYLQGIPSLFSAVNAEGDHIIVREYTSVIFVSLIAFELVRYRRENRLFRHAAEMWRRYGPGGSDRGGHGAALGDTSAEGEARTRTSPTE